MSLEELLTVIVPYSEKEKEIYARILCEIGLKEPVVVDPYQHKVMIWKKMQLNNDGIIREVAGIIGDKKSIILSGTHYPIAECYNNIQAGLVTFDAHNDSYIDKDSLFNSFSGDGEFLLRRKGKTYILGTNIGTHDPLKIKVFNAKKINNIKKITLPNNIFLSLDIDVFDPSITQSHHRPHTGLFKRKYLSFEDVMRTTQYLTKDRNVLGVNIAGYDPELEAPPYKTAELLKQYLGSILEKIVK
ncbi:arginase family protein [Candidatus Woesearchaeota archaeon]|nr:arginase family protein [Candidatus Woesearchaeota archaeon]